MDSIDKISKLHPRSPSVSFLLLYDRTQQYHRDEVFTCIIIMCSKAGIAQSFEVVDPYLEDEPAKVTLKQAALLARKAGLTSRFVYRPQGPGAAGRIWQIVHPRDVVLTAEHAAQFEEMNPDRIRYELTPHGKIAHLLKHW